MPITIDNSNYINSDYNRRPLSGSSSAESSGSVSRYSGHSGDGLAAGSTITGEIVEKEGDQVTIRLANDQTIQAKLQGSADIEVGMKLTFEVAKGANDQTALRPLFSNLNNNSAVMAALKAAGLPINESTLAMTDKMMQESMPVNRNALAEMFRSISSHQNVSPESIVQMTKLNMPLTESNIIQFDNYRNFEHQITNDLQNVSEGIADLFNEAVTGAVSGQEVTVQAFGNMTPQDVINEVLNLIDTDALETIKPSESDIQAAADLAAKAAQTEVVSTDQANTDPAAIQAQESVSGGIKGAVDGFLSDLKEMFISGETPAEETVLNSNLSLTAAEQSSLSADLQNILILAGESADIHEPLDPSKVMSAIKELVNEYPPENVKVIEAELAAYHEEGSETADEAVLNGKAQSDIDSLKTPNNTDQAVTNDTAGAPNSTPGSTQGITAPANNPEYTALSIKAQIHEKLNDLLSSEGFSKLLKDSVKAQMSIKPETVGENGKIDELYERIQKTTAKITELMESIGRAESDTARASSALTDNVNFMNQLGGFVSYVQLPLKMAGEDANGELYVYTNKKNLANKDGNYSALLHLDMEHLGPMDVYVTMRDHTKVSTNFYLQSEELLNFMESHIDELTARLTAKGYNTSTKVSKKNPGTPITPITDEFTKDDPQEKNHTVVSHMRFDVRA